MDRTSLRWRIRKIASELFESGEPLSIAVISDSLDVSRFWLTRRFLEVEGQSLSSYLRELRYRRARQLLRSSDLTIDQIAMFSGCGCTRTLTRLFVERHRMTAREWRRRHHTNHRGDH